MRRVKKTDSRLDFAKNFRLAISESPEDDTFRIVENNKQPKVGDRLLFDTGVWSGDVSFYAPLGQVVWITVKNINVLGTTIMIDSNHDGSREMILPPQLEHEFSFSHFMTDCMEWKFSVSTNSDAFSVSYSIESTCVGDM